MEFTPFDLPLSDPRHPFHLAHMEMALAEAEAAAAEDEVPVGAVIVSFQLGVIGRAHNQRELLHDPTAHAEMIAMTQAAVLAALVYAGVVDIVTLFVLTLLLGAANAVNQPARLALIPGLVDRANLPAAVAINHLGAASGACLRKEAEERPVMRQAREIRESALHAGGG